MNGLVDSVDNARWTILARTGSGLVWNNGGFESFNLRDDIDALYSFCSVHKPLLDKFGITLDGIVGRNYKMLRKFAILAEYYVWFKDMDRGIFEANFYGS